MTTEQLTLNLAPLTEVEYVRTETLAERFTRFHEANPHVADVLESLADSWLLLHDRVGMKALVERARWESGIQTRGDSWRINNSYTSMYARLLIARRPEWADAFETRELRAA